MKVLYANQQIHYDLDTYSQTKRQYTWLNLERRSLSFYNLYKGGSSFLARYTTVAYPIVVGLSKSYWKNKISFSVHRPIFRIIDITRSYGFESDLTVEPIHKNHIHDLETYTYNNEDDDNYYHTLNDISEYGRWRRYVFGE